MTVTFYDAGQALAALVTLPDERRILVDTGESPTRPGCGSAACGAWNSRVVEGIMSDLDGDLVDLLWITHQHSDHHGGLPWLSGNESFRVAHYVDNGTRDTTDGVRLARTAATKAGATLHVVDPENVSVPIPDAADVEITPVVPPDQWPVFNCDSRQNECSIGLRIEYCESTILFTGDAEHLAERAWPVGDVNLLQVGHHGSDTSSTEEFIERLQPEYAVISSAKRDEGTNRTYCHPILSTVQRLTDATGGPGSRKVEVYDASVRKCRNQTAGDWKRIAISDRLWITAFDGEVTLVTTGDGLFERVGLAGVNTATSSHDRAVAP